MKGRRTMKWTMTETVTMRDGAQGAVFTDKTGRQMRVDFCDAQRLEEHGVDANIEVYGIGQGWAAEDGRPITPKLHRYMTDQILQGF